MLAKEDVSHGIDVGDVGLFIDDWNVAISDYEGRGEQGERGREGVGGEGEGRGKEGRRGGEEGKGGERWEGEEWERGGKRGEEEKDEKGEHGRRGSEQDSMPPQTLKRKLIVTCV